jgi:predicted nucleic acid-binding protein
MNGPGDILVDTNLIILGIGGDEGARELLEGHSLFISVISEIKLLSIAFQKAQEERLMRDFISNCFVIGLDNEIKRQTIQLRRNHKIKIPDAIIAASSIVKKIPLFTADRGFSKVPTLDMVLFRSCRVTRARISALHPKVKLCCRWGWTLTNVSNVVDP